MDELEKIALLQDALWKAREALQRKPRHSGVGSNSQTDSAVVYLAQQVLQRRGVEAQGRLRTFIVGEQYPLECLALTWGEVALGADAETAGWQAIAEDEEERQRRPGHEPAVVRFDENRSGRSGAAFEAATKYIRKEHAELFQGLAEELHSNYLAQTMQQETPGATGASWRRGL